ncbi:hypothetical protein SNE40_016370 [Patella caerulea]|uniref:Alpha-ketoglutarate-dependent dioxygenase alkB homolog 3 n=1 Tax=Patella caerulea TaxID=87958 RepID=A0AAN8J938_PATCE
MSKPRRSRVQGGWADPPKKKDVRSDMNRIKPPEVPIWTGKNIDQASSSSTHKFQYVQPSAEELQQKPSDIIINKGGVYDISEGNNGISRLRFFPDFLQREEADGYFAELYESLPWKQTTSVKNGISYIQPRLTAWIGDLPYTYSGITHHPDSKWVKPLPDIKDKIEDLIGYKFNSLLCNLYRNDKDGVEWHCDDEPELGPQPIIASISLGDTRNFELRKKPVPNTGDYSLSQVVRMPLKHGSLLIMEGATQDDWQHRVPKEYHDRDSRINLTFRVIYPAK